MTIIIKEDCARWAEISAKSCPLLCPVCRDDDNMWMDKDDNGVWLCHSCGTEFVTPRWIRWMEGQVVDEDTDCPECGRANILCTCEMDRDDGPPYRDSWARANNQ